MENYSTLPQLIPVKTDYPVTRKMNLSIETRDLSDSWVIQANFSARYRPTKEFPQVISVPHGYGFYWLRAYNAGWTDNIDAQRPGEYPRPLQGFDFENKHQYIYAARRAQLVAIAGNSWVGYELEVDESQGGTKAYTNTSGADWNLYFYLNDRMDGYNDTTDFYFDNAGSANCDIVVYRLPGY